MQAQFSSRSAEHLIGLVLAGIHREYPNKILHALESDADVAPPRSLTPIFFGCYDWHSAVHGHWTLVRLCRLFPDASAVDSARAALAHGLTPEKVAAELAHLDHPGRRSFEVPYGMGWLLTLALELHEWDDADARTWHTTLAPLAELAAARLLGYLERLPHPVRTGEHAQTAFGAGLFLDWAHGCGATAMGERARIRLRELYASDENGALHLEPSGYDFLSPCLAEADLMRRVLGAEEFSDFLRRFLPQIPVTLDAQWLAPALCPDPSDGKLAHLDGLNSSRAWMLEGIAHGLPTSDARRGPLLAAAAAHAERGLAAVTGEHYAGSHWLGSFAAYQATRRGAARAAR